MKLLLVDVSHILKMFLHAAERMDSATTVDDKKIPDAHEGYEIFLKQYMITLKNLKMVPNQTVLVKDGINCKAMRREFLPEYSVRPKGPPEWMEQFVKAQAMVEDTITKYGGMSVVKDGVEADDIIAALAKTCDCIIWSGDFDMHAAGDVYFKGRINHQTKLPPEVEKKHIVVYKSLVGDAGDKIPGCVGWGDATFLKMITQFGLESLDDMLAMLEEEALGELADSVAEFAPFKMILNQEKDVYNSYKCAKFYHPGYDLVWNMQYPCGNGDLKQWEPVNTYVTYELLTDPFLDEFCKLVNESPYNSLDFETYTTPEGKEWMKANTNKQGRMPLDVLGSKLAGMAITTGSNSHITYYFPIDHKNTDNIKLVDAELLLDMLPEPRQNIPLIIQNTAFELTIARMHFDLNFDRGYLPQLMYDTKVMSGYVDEYDLNNLKHNSKRWLGYDQVSYEEVTGGLDMCDLEGQDVFAYGIDDTICCSSLYRQYRVIMEYEGSWECYKEVDVVPQFIYTERYINGVQFDLDKIDELQVVNHKEYKDLYKKIQKFLGNLEWDQEDITKKKVPRITLKNLKSVDPTDYEEQRTITHHKWPGCTFVPATEFTPAEIKRLYKDHTGEPLVCRVRKFEKMAEVIDGLGECAFADCVREESLECLNTLVADSFTPQAEIKLRSVPEMVNLMYVCLGLPVRITNKLTPKMREEGRDTGNPSANSDAIANAVVHDLQDNEPVKEFMETVLKAKSYLTEDSLYLTPYKNMPHYSDGCVHPQFAISAQKSGRGTASQPNDSQVAKDSGVREIYIPYDDDDYLWVSLDFESQELVHTAEHSKDKNMMDCFRGERKDIHSVTGAGIYNIGRSGQFISYEDFNRRRKTEKEFKDIRNKKAKPTNFLKNYGGGPLTLAIDLLCSKDEAKDMLAAQGAAFPGIDTWIANMEELNEKRGYAVTPMGRRRHVTYAGNKEWMIAHQLRAAGNHPIQGGSAEQVKLVLKELWNARVYDTFDAYFQGTVHDEVNSIVHRKDVLEFIKVVHPIMCRDYADFSLKFTSSIEIGKNFGTLIEVGNTVDEQAILKVLEEI